ncbi:NAD(P)-dependent dehydrogenase (short-subunit alcohol dehydrogenase family) [Sphingopyxis panaciterrae]|uniref:SDR family NAD(P)-dependent oxidoreductase n=1 Tax=Sphingopyxis panaciterrae TaxID=363841 RepID=UPI00141E12E9|nr:SDR family oxidoreductase [Sphingopyxis panaciterrae]NIJ35952.1 NAD(P)-dependent dehydrogenase (short-subunit alcohol dehydrogenase family) [Sphingopyxis panaciterrae]
MFELDGRVALVTGAAKGIGAHAARLLAAAGATVVATDIAPSGSAPPGGRFAQQDVTDPDHWDRIVASIKAEEGRLDILVNNAGMILNKPVLSTTIEEFRRVHAVNVESIWFGVQAAAPLMAEAGAGSIINLSSIYGQIAGPMQAAYSASKGAVRMLTKAVAVEFGRAGNGIRVNSVHPGPVDTDLGRSGLEPGVTAGRFASEAEAKAYVASMFPMGRWVETQDVAGVILFLASDASRYVTGTELTVDGGYSIL